MAMTTEMARRVGVSWDNWIRIRRLGGQLTLIIGAQSGSDTESDTQLEDEKSVRMKRVASPTVSECGFRFQRCGGGRRVLRKKIGGD